MNKSTRSFYDRVVQVTHIYLGPAADRFISRQVQNHLHKEPDALSSRDLLKLIDWIKLAMSLLTEDSELIEEYAEKLHHLAQSSSRD